MCDHLNFEASVGVHRLEDTGQFMSEVKVWCRNCREPFQFLGLSPGLDLSGARVSVDGLEANIAIAPSSQSISPLQSMQLNIGSSQ